MLNKLKRSNKDVKGVINICLASLFFTLMSAFVKLTSSNLGLIEIIFLRSLIATFILIPFILVFKENIKTNLYTKHLIRALIGITSMLLNFYALSKIPLTNYTVISFTKIFFVIPFAFLLLKEKIQISLFFYVSIGFLGVFFIVGYEESDKVLFPYYICALLANILIAYIKIFIKNISKRESNTKIQFYFSLNSTIILSLPFFLLSNSNVLLIDIFFIFLLSIFGLLAQYFTIKGLKSSQAVKVMPFDYSRVIFGSIIGISFFSENISEGIIFGSLIIIFSGIKLMKNNPNN